jgi:hypothetical protein
MVCGHCPPYISVEDLENQTGYRFLSNIPSNIQQTIKGVQKQQLIGRINQLLVTAPLMADTNSINTLFTVSQNNGTDFNSSILQSSIPKESSIGSISSIPQSFIGLTSYPWQTQGRSTEVSFNQIGEIESNRATLTQRPTEIGSGQISIAKVNLTQIATIPTSLYQISSPQIGVSKITSVEGHVISRNSNQGSITEISSFNVIPISKVAPVQINSTQISFVPQSGITMDVIKDQTWEVSSTSSVEFQKLFNSINTSSGVKTHDLTPNLLTDIYSTAQSIWHSNTAIDLNFTISNLPTGQLAEATINGYDQLGRPNTATISQ